MEIQTIFKDLPAIIKQLDISPDASVRVTIEKIERKDQKKRHWAEVAQRISQEGLLTDEAAAVLHQASRNFREDFQFREPPYFEQTENESK